MDDTGAKNPDITAQQGSDTESKDSVPTASTCRLLTLPSEILHQILLYLPAISLYAISLTCHSLQTHSFTDPLWENIIDSPDLVSPHPYLSYRSLHHALAPHLYLKRKIFIGDRQYFGSLLVSKFMPISGTLEAFSFTAPPSRDIAEITAWSYNPDVIITPFSPKINIREEPELKIAPNSRASEDGEIPVSRRGILATYFRAEAILQQDVYSQMAVWPPRTIPAETRVRNESSNGFKGGTASRQRGPFIRLPSNISINGTFVSVGGFNDVMGAAVDRSAFITPPSKAQNDDDKWIPDEMKQKSGFLSQKAFRLRRWAVLGDTSGDLENRFRMGERVETFAELDEELWTPTPEYPYRGIWVGDFGPHGAEFLLFHQPTTSSSQKRLEVIKLTGDPNIPRGEYTWIVDDLSQPVRTADEEETEWPGAKVYSARGHIAAHEFKDDKFIDVQAILPLPEKDWQDAQEQREITPSEQDVGEAEESERSDDIGEGWGVGSQERLGPGGRSRRHGNTEPAASLLDQPWVPRRVAVYWHGMAELIHLYYRADIGKFLD
ncbi:hypothetical protein TWF281_010354 [Arthrobotrys megalospora]